MPTAKPSLCSRTTSRSYHNAKFITCRVDKVLHNKEVAWETHGLHNMQLKLYTLVHLVGKRVAIKFLCSIVGKFGKIVGLELYSIQLVKSAKLLYFLLGILVRHNLVAILVGSKLAEQLLWRYALTGFFLGAKLLRNGEERHDRGMVDGIKFHLVQYLKSVAQGFGHIREDSAHLLTCLKPLLL